MGLADRPESLRATAASGILFAVTFIAAFVLLADLLGSFADSDETFSQYYESLSNRNGSVLGAVLLFASGIALLPFAGGLTRHLNPEGESSSAQLLTQLPYVVSGLIIASAAATGTVGGARVMADIFDETSKPFQGASIVVLPQFGYALIVFAAWTEALFLLLVGVLTIRSGVQPTAVGWLAIICAAALLTSPAVISLLALPVWVLIASVFMLCSDAKQRRGQ